MLLYACAMIVVWVGMLAFDRAMNVHCVIVE